jgi:8-oxo-dGTP diphosphatase
MVEIQVVGAAIREGTKVLAAQRSAKMNMPLKWEFAGGKVEENETHQQALKREVYEELGLIVEVLDFLAVGYSEINGKTIALYVYDSKIKGGEINMNEHSQIKWVEIRELEKLDWAEADIPACKKLIELYGE